jgi:hypothetical protein
MRTSPASLLRLVLVVLGLLLAPSGAQAHPVRTTAVFLDLGDRSVEGEWQLPLDQLGLALERTLTDRAASLVAEQGPELEAYVASHLGATAPDGRPFAVTVNSLVVQPVDGADALVARVSLVPPAGASTRTFTLRDNVILHRVVTHKIFVSIRRDFRNAVFADHPQLVGVLAFQRESALVDQSGGSWWRGFRSVFVLGARHIADGTDHLLFLLMLLLPAPLVARAGRWQAEGSAARGLRGMLGIVTAFSLGHSLTLLAAARGLVHVPGRPVEVLVAVSILVSAVHALRPLFPGKEALLAGLFGLIHGLAFATVLADFGFGGWALGASLLGFNLGIEAMQLLVVALTVPWLILLCRTPFYRGFRVAGALVGAAAAAGWIAERALGWTNPIGPLVEAAADHSRIALLLLALASIAAFLGRRPPAPGPAA